MIVLLHGAGSNGKTSLMKIVERLLGPQEDLNPGPDDHKTTGPEFESPCPCHLTMHSYANFSPEV